MLLGDRRAIVTGGARGIGRAIARRFVDLGARTITVDVDDAEHDLPHLLFDLADIGELPTLVSQAEASIGPVDILVNCAAIPSDVAVADLTGEHFDEVLGVNLKAPLFLTQAVLPGMIARGYGRIVNISSVHGLRGAANHLSYDVSKAGLLAVTRTTAMEVADKGVLINAIAPGFVDTRGTDLTTEMFKSVYVGHRRLPMGRAGQPEEVAQVVAWLASEENSYVTGACLPVDGGLLIGF